MTSDPTNTPPITPSPAFKAFMESELEKIKLTGRLPHYVLTQK